MCHNLMARRLASNCASPSPCLSWTLTCLVIDPSWWFSTLSLYIRVLLACMLHLNVSLLHQKFVGVHCVGEYQVTHMMSQWSTLLLWCRRMQTCHVSNGDWTIFDNQDLWFGPCFVSFPDVQPHVFCHSVSYRLTGPCCLFANTVPFKVCASL